MTIEHVFAFSRRIASEVCRSFAHERRGRRECRVHAAPAVSCARSTWKCAHEHTGSAGASRPSLRNGFTAYNVISPAGRARCHRRRRNCFHQLDASLGRQDHTSLPYALMPFAIGTASVHRDPPHDRGDHDTPLWSGRDGLRCSRDFDSGKQKYFRFARIFRLTSILKIGIYLPFGLRCRPAASQIAVWRGEVAPQFCAEYCDKDHI